MNHPACDVTHEELLAFTEEDLPERRMSQLEAHVPDCPACQRRLAESDRIGNLLRETLPQPDDRARQDLLVRLCQEAAEQSRPRHDWAPVASVAAIGGIFLLALVLLWSGIDQFLDTVSAQFQTVENDSAIEWVEDGDDAEAAFRHAPLPDSLSGDFRLYDWWVRSGIRVLVYQDGPEARMLIEVSQFHVEDDAPPAYLDELDAVDGVTVYADDDREIHELRWTVDGTAHHLQFQALDGSPRAHLTPDDAREIVRVFLE